MVDVIPLPQKRSTSRHARGNGTSEVVQLPSRGILRGPSTGAPKIRVTPLPDLPPFLPEVPLLAKPEAVSTRSPLSEEQVKKRRYLAMASLHVSRFELEKIRAQLKKHSDGGSKLIPKLQSVIDAMERDLNTLEQ